MRQLDRDVDITTTLTFYCTECKSPLMAKIVRDGEIEVEFCQSCRDDTDNNAFDRGYSEGKEVGRQEAN